MAIYFLPPLKTKLKKPPTEPSAHSQSTATCDRPLLVMHLWEGENTRNTMDNNVLGKASKRGLPCRTETNMHNYKGQKENYPGTSALNTSNCSEKKLRKLQIM